MNAANPLTQDDRSAERRSNEPSMEEILASIRRIIADDQGLTLHREPNADAPAPEPFERPPAASVSPLHPARDVVPPPVVVPVKPAEAPSPRVVPLDLRDLGMRPSFAGAGPAAADERHHEERPAPPPEAPRPRMAEAPPREEKAAPRPSADDGGPLVSAASAATIGTAFDALTATHTLQNSGMLADLAREMLRPLLKSWLDDNLPVIVERLVRLEIERVARGGR